MKLIEHLDYILGLVDKDAPYSQIKGSILAMREEVDGYEQASSNQAALNQKHSDEMAKLKEEYENFKNQPLAVVVPKTGGRRNWPNL
jgi:DNA repair exonuclease SbcCD ATPase subunit